ncbi:nitrite reductase large subunit NirB [Aquipuribacter hungaricus]|uniref:assimilatory sulfite reductase (ferredoxin) n=1 Tax=Aquipuribacter hungaricus TaxID=545624 RepID=A0ABV7WLK0_9MICO
MSPAPRLPHRVVVVGHGMVGHHLLTRLRDGLAGADPATRARLDVTVLAEEHRPAYDRVGLSSYLAGRSEADMTMVEEGFFDAPADPDDSEDVAHRFALHLATPAVALDRTARTVTDATGALHPYDTLVLATGSSVFVPPVPGHDAPGTFVYRTLDDLDAIAAYARGRRSGAVVGGGLLGLEAAEALQRLGLEPHVVQLSDRLMPLQLDEGGAGMLRRHVEQLGMTVHLDASTTRVRTGPDGSVAGLDLADGRRVDVDLVVFSPGIRPRDELARASGLDVGGRGGVVVDDACRTSDPDVYAVGECALAQGQVWGLVAPGYAMAAVVAEQVLARVDTARPAPTATFTGADMSTTLKLTGIPVASVADCHGRTPGALELVWNDPTARVYKKVVVDEVTGAVLGAVLVGDAEAYPTLKALAASAGTLPGTAEQVLFPRAGDGPVVAGPAGLPDAAVVCSCLDVTKGSICAAVHDGARDVAAVKGCTRAGTGCGSCVPMIAALVTSTLDTMGVEVDRSLCEHFALTRRELYDLVRLSGHTTFTQVVTAHGTGRGCDICKPTVANILATLAPAHVLDGENAALQDTNDHVMANMQKNGTYSVVPRMPGGEVTPAGLIVIGEVARDFGLYTKLTGGQRIDMFGARLDQLPAIWRRLVDAGFESGHAYGKSLRTVKSCVGTDWCRYGVQDSTGLAVALEERYRGLRSPHKLKSGVSGCARECAEARSKDFGIIATELGWNLYVGGNGGMRPRHAELLVKDVSTEDLVRYVDRYLMFYVRTADRLQRTSTWVESLVDPDSGLSGVDYLHHVVVEDALGIGAELEADMARHVDSYADEWAATLDDPEKLRRFSSFVNAPETPDPSVRFTLERGQIRPATDVEVAAGRSRPGVALPMPEVVTR